MNIEEIAFRNVEELICLRKISLLAIIDFLQKDRKECLNQFAKTHNESVEILKENKQLKDNWNKLKEWLKEYKEGTYGLGSYETGLSDGLGDVIKKMQELEQESDSNE